MLALAAVFGACAVAADVADPSDYENKVDVWSGAVAHIATVNAFGAEKPDGNLIRLRGEWDFVTQDIPYRATLNWFTNACLWKKVRKINVPGCWEAQGVGEPGNGRPWACFWDAMNRPLTHQYEGQGWYRRLVRIPSSWSGRRVWLKIGGVNCAGWFLVNGEPAGSVESYCGSYKFDVTALLEPGKEAELLLIVSNRMPTRKGDFCADNKWGGLWRDVELEATPQTYIDDAWVRGDFDSRKAVVKVTVEGRDWRKDVALRATVDGESKETRVSPLTSTYELDLPLRNFRPWSPEHPNLYTAKIELVSADGRALMTRWERFGVRKLEARGKEFFFNGRPFFLRGVGWHTMNPIDGIDFPSRTAFAERLRKVKAAGFNAVRFHTHCKFPEFFEAADEVGLLLAPDLPYYQDFPADAASFDPFRDAFELWRHYRRHPSFAIYSGGNEGTFGTRLARRLYRSVKAADPDRLFIEQDGVNPGTEGAGDFVSGPVTAWEPGLYDPNQPFVAHEYLNLCIKMDTRLEPKFTGVWKSPVSRERRKAWLARFGLTLETGDELQEAMNAFQRIWQKMGIEAARLDPHCDGYGFWSLYDVCSPQKEAVTAPSLFDVFFNEKPGGSTVASFARYNSEDCLLLDTERRSSSSVRGYAAYYPDEIKFSTFVSQTNRVRTAGETINARFLLAHYSERDQPTDEFRWSLVAGGRTLAEGSRRLGLVERGGARLIEEVDIPVPADLPKAMKAELKASLGDVRNSWDFWLFPKRQARPSADIACSDCFRGRLGGRYPGLRSAADAAGARVLIAATGSQEAAAAQSRGQSVVLMDNQDTKVNVTLGWWWLGTQMGSVLRPHAVLARLPQERTLTQLFFRISKEGTPLPVAGLNEKELVVFGEGGEACFLYLSARENPNGSREVRISGLDVLSDTPEGTAVLDGVLDWAGGGK